MRNPSPKSSFTPEQEARIATAEAMHMHIRADVITAGVAKHLERSEYSSRDLLAVCAQLLSEAAALHDEAYGLKSLATGEGIGRRRRHPRVIIAKS